MKLTLSKKKKKERVKPWSFQLPKGGDDRGEEEFSSSKTKQKKKRICHEKTGKKMLRLASTNSQVPNMASI